LALTTEELRTRLTHQQWTAHNIRLNDELTTRPDTPDFEKDTRLKAIDRIFRLIFGDSYGNGLRIADLGSLEGGYALSMANRGASVVGLEARKANFEKLQLVQNHFGLGNLHFELRDVKDFHEHNFGTFDAVLALGILYHLDEPVQWLRQVAQATKRVIVIDSHFAPSDQNALDRIDPRLAALSPIEKVTVGGGIYSGRWFREFEPATDPEGQLWASYSNWQSFWLTKESLVRAVRDSGFDLVLEQHDYSADIFDRLNVEFPRTILVGVKLSR